MDYYVRPAGEPDWQPWTDPANPQQVPDEFADGLYEVGVRQTDVAGNESLVDSVTVGANLTQVVVFDLVRETSTEIEGARIFDKDVEYFIYIVVDADRSYNRIWCLKKFEVCGVPC